MPVRALTYVSRVVLKNNREKRLVKGFNLENSSNEGVSW